MLRLKRILSAWKEMMSCFKGCSVQNPEAMKDNIKVRCYYYNIEQMDDDINGRSWHPESD